MKTVETLYDYLGVTPQAASGEIRDAFRRIARETHPDRNPDPDAKRRFQNASEAYAVLSDPVRRVQYDRGSARRYFGSLADFFGEHPVANSVMTRMLPAAKASPVPGKDVRRLTVVGPVTENRRMSLWPLPRGHWLRYIDQGEPGKNGALPGDAWVFVAPEKKMRK